MRLAGLALLVAVSGSAAGEPNDLHLDQEARPGFHRLTFPWHRMVDYRIEQIGDVVTISFRSAKAIADHEAAARESRLIRRTASRRVLGASELTLVLEPDARVRYFRHGPRVIVDVMAPPAPLRRAAALPNTAEISDRPTTAMR
ncbi:MAG: hypothetical protein QF893_06485 [Alphaproteobacteria bacterium]|jgi:hypothetical protein|nr:hypothetical protein [Alphaproteobacteria bacterium]